MNTELADCVTDTLVDAQDANLSVQALLELLNGCPPEYPLSAGLFVGLVRSVASHMANVVDGLRVLERSGLAA